MEKNKKKAFTMVELVVVLAVSVIVLGMVASLSVLVNKILQTERQTSSRISEYENVKTETENFLSKYSVGGYEISIKNESEEEKYSAIYIYDQADSKSEKTLVARFEFSNGFLKIYEATSVAENEESNAENEESNENSGTEQKFDIETVILNTIKSINYEISSDFNIIKCVIEYENYSDMKFLVNLGGLEIGN